MGQVAWVRVREIAKKTQEKKLFDVVVIVEITANPNTQKIQQEIAYVLGLRLEGDGEIVRADCLRRRLKKEKNTLIILDDLWDKLDLKKLGIPLGDDNDRDDDDDDLIKMNKLSKMTSNDKHDLLSKMTSIDNVDLNRNLKKDKSLDYKGCKILLTSRDKKVLSDKMDIKSIFSVKGLDHKDALMLFKKVAGIPDEMPNYKQEIVKKYCSGLPMAIVTVGKALKDKEESVWKKTLDELKNQELVEVQKSMEISVGMSYGHLENEELKSIFLVCAQMDHQPLIMDLVKYCYGLGILEGVYSLREARNRINTSIQKLKDSSLILDGSSSNHFNMHDMVRDAALSIAHKEQNVFTLRNGKLDDWPELKRCTSISICNSDIIDELPNVINCPQLKFFQIDSHDPYLKIPENFFKGMKRLRVLILTGFHLPSLPSSIKFLSNLGFLCLERCILDGNLSFIGELKKLRVLSFSGSQIENFPAELGCLDMLQLLDISNCSIMTMILPTFISRLTCLEELYIRKSLIKMLAEGETNQSSISFLSELKHLHELKVVDLCIPRAIILPLDLFFDKLNDYKIVIGEFRMLSVGDFRMPNKYEASRSLALQLNNSANNIHSHKGIKLLFRKVENLLLGEINGVENVICELNLDGFPHLKHLSIINNTCIKYIMNSMDMSHLQDVFPNLESLCLYKLRNIEMICCSPITNASFTKLKTIKVEMCSQLKNLFSFYMVKFLASLKTIDVSECDSVKEITEILVNSDKVEFLKLQSLTLQSLPSFTSFYTIVERPSVPQLTEAQITNRDHIEITIADEHNDMTPFSLFGELVEIPNLESLNLSSINIHKIWSDVQSPSSFCFQNLIKLVVKDCHRLIYLCSLSVASCLKKLKTLFISNCQMMEMVFSTEGNSEDKACVFPNLEEIQLSEMKMLTDIWQAEVTANSFSSLISVHIEGCKKLEKIFPSHMEGWYTSLESLKVVYCESVEVIFEIKDSQQIDAYEGIDTSLQFILINHLPNMKQVWSKDSEGILHFKKLQSVQVSSCDKLWNVFPASVAKNTEKLEYMSIRECSRMVEVVTCEDGLETKNEPLVFPELTYMGLYYLGIKRFYDGRYIERPKLKQLEVQGCSKLKTFPTENWETTKEEENALFSAEKVIPNLECMKTDFDKLTKWFSSKSLNYRMHSLKELSLRSVSNGELLYRFLYRMPNLEKLQLHDSEHLLKESSVPCLGTVLQLKELVLLWSKIKDLGFERDPVLQRLEILSLKGCNELSYLALPSVSLIYLTFLEVKFCKGLRNLLASSTAKSLVQLRTMKVIDCANVKEIVIGEGNEEGQVTDIVFSKLITIELAELNYLTSFCRSQNCNFKFPSLEVLIVRECPMMETFTKGHTRVPKLQNILAVEGEEEAKWQLEGDLNATIQKVFKDKVTFMCTKNLDISVYPEFVDQLWHGNHLVQQNCFRNLKSFYAYGCEGLVHVIPSHLLHCFENLEELDVDDCSAVQVIFNINEMRETKNLGIIRLKKLTLNELPELEHIWDKNPEGIVGLQVLQEMRVIGCECLKSLFPASVPKDLTRLEVLWVIDCPELVELFSKDEKAAEGAIEMFLFRCLTSLRLYRVPGLKYFYPGLHTVEWPVLEELHCSLVKFACQEEYEWEEEDLIQIQKDVQVSSLKELPFGIGDATVKWDRECGQLLFAKLQSFQIESDSAPLYKFLDMLPRIEKLKFVRCLFEEMFAAERPNALYTTILLHLKGLELLNLDNLKSIGLDHSWLQPISENLQTLQVYKCHNLENLVPCTVSFSNLTYLKVSTCKRLLYLFTSSTAKSLAQLKRMEIKWCESLLEIVSTEGGESHDNGQIVFKQLQVVYLKKLDQLKCFYSGNFPLRFPSLEQVYTINCSWMKTFCPINIIDHPIKLFSAKNGTPQQDRDLNSAALRMFEEKILESARSGSGFNRRDSPLQEIWHSSLPIPPLCFSNLACLIVKGSQFLSDVVLPFNLLPFLTKLETLEVRDCDSVKTIFDVKCITQDRRIIQTTEPAQFPLKKLTLCMLPNLENVWNEDPREILRMQLQQVSVDNCKCLASVFPTSVAKDLVKLEDLVVKHCEQLMAIVAEDNADPRRTNHELTFPCMQSLTLWDLPEFKCFYYCSLQCDILKACTRTHLEPFTEDQVCIAKLTPNLQNLTLGENEVKVIWRGDFEGNILHNLQILTLLSYIESDALPYGFLLPKMPNIEKLVLRRSSLKHIFWSQSPNGDCTGLLSHVKVLSLYSLPELVSIGSENTWIEPFLTNLETLEVFKCSRLRNLAPSPVYLSNLVCFVLSGCDGLVNLFTSSTAKSLAKLKTMEIISCDSIEEIVSKEVDESQEDEIIFPQLNCLKLEYLRKLRRFYKGSLSFPSLEQLSVINCNMMETFCTGTIDASKLSPVNFQAGSNAIPLEKDLNSTMQKAFLAALPESARSEDSLTLRDSPLKEIWLGSVPIPDMCFRVLQNLNVDGCQFLTDVALPFNLLPLLTHLETLIVRNCDYVKTIFDVKCITQDRIMETIEPAQFPLPFRLKSLTLSKLPNLENVWNEDPLRILRIQLLSEVSVDNCKGLTSVFPVSVAKDIVKLEKLVVQHCEELMAIVAEDNADPRGSNLELTFPWVKSMTLCDLPKLKYKGTCCILEHASNVQHLTLGENELKMILGGEFQGNHLHKLKVLTFYFHMESNLFLKQVPNIEKLVVCDGSFKEISSFQSSNVDETGLLSQLKVLCLDSLPELVSIGLENPWIVPFLRNLKTLEVTSLFSSTNLVPCTISFSNLTSLTIISCNSLVYLFTSSTAKSLAQLKRMDIQGCDSIKEIVSEEGDGSNEDELIFGQLNYLNLQNLKNLISFYKGCLSFPSLEKLSVIQCDSMETLCPGTVKADKLLGVKFQDSSTTPLEVDLHFTMQKQKVLRARAWLRDDPTDVF